MFEGSLQGIISLKERHLVKTTLIRLVWLVVFFAASEEGLAAARQDKPHAAPDGVVAFVNVHVVPMDRNRGTQYSFCDELCHGLVITQS